VLKTLDQFDWTWPTKINRPQIQNLFRLRFIEALKRMKRTPMAGRWHVHCGIAWVDPADSRRRRAVAAPTESRQQCDPLDVTGNAQLRRRE
jgi:hypothetical protein